MKIADFKSHIKLFFTATTAVLGSSTSRSSQESKTMHIKNQILAYTKSGTGKPSILFIHGWGQTKETWEAVKNNLQHQGTIYTLDLPGFGQSSLTKSLTLIEYVSIVNAFLKKEKITSCILIGHSFGGKISALFALKYPKKVEKLILYSTGIEHSRKNIFNYLLQIYPLLTTKSFSAYLLLRKTYQKTHSGKEFKNKLHLLQQKVLLIYGKYDYLVPPSQGNYLETLLPNTKYILFEHSTHLAHIEEKEKFLKVVIDFASNNKL